MNEPVLNNIKDVYFHNLLVAVDDSPDAVLAFKYAIHRAIKDEVGLTLVSVLENDDYNIYEALSKDFVHGAREDMEKRIAEYKQKAEEAGVKEVHTVVAEGDPGETIVKEVIPHVKPDLLIIGSKSKEGIKKRFGSQAAYMAKYSPVSVLVVR